MGDVVGSVNYSGTFLGKQVESHKELRVGQALQQNGAVQTFASRDEALAAIEHMPPSETDYAVMQRPDGRFEVRALEQDYSPEQAASAHLVSTPPNAHPSAPGEPVAVVFRGTVESGMSRIHRNQVITNQGVQSQSTQNVGAVGDTPPPAPGSPEARVADQLPPMQRQQFLALGPADRATFAQVYLDARPNVRQRLAFLLADGKCAARGSDGQTVMDHMRRLQTQPLAVPPGKNEQDYRDGLMGELSEHIWAPTASISQKNRGTCAATCGQIEFATRSPADYAKFIVGLTSASGEATLPDGSHIRRVPDSLVRHGDDERSTLNRIAQSAIMNYHTGSYSAETDHHQPNLPVIGQVDGGGGMTHEDTGAFLHAIRRGNAGVIQTPGFTWDVARGITGGDLLDSDSPTIMRAVADDLQAQRQAGEAHPMVPCGLTWGGADSSHEVLVTEVTNDRVFFRNPHGYVYNQVENDEQGHPRPVKTDEQGREYVEAPYPNGGPNPVRFYRDGSQSMPRQDFTNRLHGACLTKGTSERYRAHEADQMSQTVTSVLG